MRVATGAGSDAVIAQDLSEEFLHVAVASPSNDGGDEFDFDAEFTIEIGLAFHTQVYRVVLKCASKTGVLFTAILSTISATTMCLDFELSAAKKPSKVVGATRVDMSC